MKRVVLTLTVLTAIGLASATAFAGGGYRGYGRHYGNPYYLPGYGQGYYSDSRGVNSHAAAVKRIMASHSRYRFNPHPRSNFKSPPHPYDYWGW
ncbi:MAG: hypothetical protein JXB62_11210 [Pirellulales bacterium]|nr:hypothetical protein [Pirellulales bacterium]